jgi:hypothetical protein
MLPHIMLHSRLGQFLLIPAVSWFDSLAPSRTEQHILPIRAIRSEPEQDRETPVAALLLR